MTGVEWTDRYTEGLPTRAGSTLHDPSTSPTGSTSCELLVALANNVVETAYSTVVPGPPEPHLGADLRASSDPHAEQLRAAKASFDWLAFAHPGAPMWEEHVGVVHVGHAAYDVGVHIADHLPSANNRIQQIADSLGRPPTHSGPSSEYQLVVRRLHLPEQQDDVVRLSLDLYQHMSRIAASPR